MDVDSFFGGMLVKRIVCLTGMLLLLAGCSGKQTYETISDVNIEPVSAQAMKIVLDIPRDAATQVMEGEDTGTIYFADDYTLCVQVLEAGDLNGTLLACTGFEREKLQLQETQTAGHKRYEAVWSCAGESGDQVGRIAVLDDGNYHYTVTTMADAEKAGELTAKWHSVYRSFRLEDPDAQVNSDA